MSNAIGEESVTDIAKAVASFERNIEAQTGKSVAAWAGLAMKQRLAKHSEIVAYLKSEHALSHSHANHIAKSALKPVATADDPVAHLFQGGKEDLRPLYDRLVSYARSLGADVEIAPKKVNVSLRRRRQFALLQPTTRTRLDLGLILPDEPPGGRLEKAGSFNAMFTHRIKIARLQDIDAEVRRWVKRAYDEAK
jgi:hypothetical protein